MITSLADIERTKKGAKPSSTTSGNFGTGISEKQGGTWSMVHHAAVAKQALGPATSKGAMR